MSPCLTVVMGVEVKVGALFTVVNVCTTPCVVPKLFIAQEIKEQSEFPVTPERVSVKLPVVPVTITLITLTPEASATVGVESAEVNAYTNPLSVIAAPPSEVTSPCKVASIEVIAVAAELVTVGTTPTVIVKV